MIEAKQQTTYQSGTGKLMHMMQHLQPEVYNCVQDQARHMGHAGKKHMKAILRCMKYCVDRPNHGMVLQQDVLWDGNPKILFIVSGEIDSDYSKRPITHRSVSGGHVMSNVAPVQFRSSMQKIVALLVMAAELYAATMTAQDMLYLLHVLE